MVDIHCHTAVARPGSADELVEAASDAGVKRLLLLGDVLAFGFHPTPEQIRIINDDTAAAVDRLPEVVAGFCHLNPELPAATIEDEIERCMTELGLRGIKLEATVVATDPRLDLIMRRAEDLRVPLVHHAWHNTLEPGGPQSTPADIANLASRFPRVPILMPHLGGARIRGIQDIRPYANVRIDTSGSQPGTELVEYAVAALGADRVLYGSDVPGRDYAPQLGRVLGARISESEKQRILYRNAEQFLGL